MTATDNTHKKKHQPFNRVRFYTEAVAFLIGVFAILILYNAYTTPMTLLDIELPVQSLHPAILSSIWFATIFYAIVILLFILAIDITIRPRGLNLYLRLLWILMYGGTLLMMIQLGLNGTKFIPTRYIQYEQITFQGANYILAVSDPYDANVIYSVSECHAGKILCTLHGRMRLPPEYQYPEPRVSLTIRDNELFVAMQEGTATAYIPIVSDN
jgi:hypothetical protein